MTSIINIIRLFLIIDWKIVSVESIIKETIHITEKNSLFGIKNALNRFNILTEAFFLDKEEIDGLKLPVIVHMEKKSLHFAILLKLSKSGARLYNGQMYYNLNREDFFDAWSGVVLAYKKERPRFRSSQILSALSYRSIVVSWFVLSNLFLFFNYSPKVLFTSIALQAGIVLSSILFYKDYSFDWSSKKNICLNKREIDTCKQLIETSKKTIFGSISWSQCSLAYFGGLYVLFGYLLISSSNIDFQNLSTIYFFCILTFPIIILSLYLQLIKFKIPCPICLSILIVLSALLGLGLYNFRSITISLNDFFLFGLFFLSIFKLLESKSNYRGVLRSLVDSNKLVDSFIGNERVRKSVFSNLRAVNTTNLDISISFDNKAPNDIIMISDLYCKPCHDIFPEYDDLIKNNKEQFNFHIVFSQRSLTNKKSIEVIQRLNLLSKHRKTNLLQDSLEKIYMHKYSSEDFVLWFDNRILKDALIQIDSFDYSQNQIRWLNEQQLAETPTFILNGKIITAPVKINQIERWI